MAPHHAGPQAATAAAAGVADRILRALGEPITLRAILNPRIISPGQVAIIAFVLMLILMVWARLASFLYAFASSARPPAMQVDFINFALQTPAACFYPCWERSC